MKNPLLIVAVAAIILVGGFALYSSSKSSSTSQVPQQTQIPEATSVPEANDDPQMEEVNGAKEITVTNQGFKFDQDTITVNKGDKVVITFENTGGQHDFKIDGYNVGTKIINGGEEDEFEFTADKAGTFEFYCSVGNHRQMGMKGTLIVK